MQSTQTHKQDKHGGENIDRTLVCGEFSQRVSGPAGLPALSGRAVYGNVTRHGTVLPAASGRTIAWASGNVWVCVGGSTASCCIHAVVSASEALPCKHGMQPDWLGFLGTVRHGGSEDLVVLFFNI